MKRYELDGIIKDGNKRIGFFITDFTGDYQIANADVILSMASQNLIRYVCVSGGQLICLFDDEEHAYLSSKGYKNAELAKLEHNYFSSLASFKSKHVSQVSNGVGICMSCMNAFVTTMELEFKVWGSGKIIDGLDYCRNTVVRLENGYVFGNLRVPLSYIDLFKPYMKANIMMCDFSCIKRKMSVYKSDIIKSTINDLANINLSLERRLGI